MAATRRLPKELCDIQQSEMKSFCNVEVNESNILQWTGLLVPDFEPYNKGAFEIKLEFPVEYPFKPPKVTFETKICHPNVDENGQVCMPIISEENWKPATKTEHVIQALLRMMNKPEPDPPLGKDIAEETEIENNIPNKTCPICLTTFVKGNPVGIPDGGCSHTFCLECIREWSRNTPTCPIDRSKFQNIMSRQSIDGKETEIEKIPELVAIDNEDEYIDLLEDGEVCEICGAGDREEYLLLCDGCNLGYHYDTCLMPPRYRVPRGRWYCPVCKTAGL